MLESKQSILRVVSLSCVLALALYVAFEQSSGPNQPPESPTEAPVSTNTALTPQNLPAPPVSPGAASAPDSSPVSPTLLDKEPVREWSTEEELLIADIPEDLEPISSDEAEDLVLATLTAYGYKDRQGREVVDVYEGEEMPIGVRVTTPEGRPVAGVTLHIQVDGTSRLLSGERSTARNGVVIFHVAGGQKGADRLTASVGGRGVEFVINVVSDSIEVALALPTVKGGIPWKELMQAQVDFKDWGVISKFPKGIRARAGKTVKLSGFMMPLEAEMKQKVFLLTSTPSSCFFHMPGGPAGSVLVVAKKGIATREEPIIVQGRFEPQASSKEDVVYKLLDAKLVEP